jgi:hypothetical protein
MNHQRREGNRTVFRFPSKKLRFAGAMEAAGIEPASADAPDRTSTSVVCALDSPGGRFADDLPTG